LSHRNQQGLFLEVIWLLIMQPFPGSENETGLIISAFVFKTEA